jgi:CHAT domain-containing protein
VVAYYEVHDERSYVAVIRRGHMAWAPLDLNRSQIVRLVDEFRNAPSSDTGQLARRALLKNVDAVLDDDDLLVIIPDGAVGLLPFAALPGRHARYLIQENAVLFAPGARAFLDASRRTGAFAGAPATISALGAGSAVVTEEGVFAALPASADEVREVAALYTGGRASSAADTAMFVDALERADVLHFAGHAWLDSENPWRSQLMLPRSPGAAALTATTLERLHVGKTRLVMLSACEAGDGMIARSEGPLSLARSLLAAGVPTVVASHQRVGDRAARALSVAFHREYRATGDPAIALRRAQEQQIANNDADVSSPIQWASFVAIGGTPSAVQFNHARDRSR